jgi:archaemetzincin
MIQLVAVGGAVQPCRLNALALELTRIFRMPCQVRTGLIDPAPARDDFRQQYRSTMILESLRALNPPNSTLLLGVAAVDLFVPIFTFVFGEAEVDGHCALASTYRLEEERYGLPANEEKLRERLTKEAVHELGHTFGLRHCDHWQCVMSSSHSVELVDVKQAEFCEDCAELLRKSSGAFGTRAGV